MQNSAPNEHHTLMQHINILKSKNQEIKKQLHELNSEHFNVAESMTSESNHETIN